MSLRTGSDVYVTRKQDHLEEVFTQTSLHNLRIIPLIESNVENMYKNTLKMGIKMIILKWIHEVIICNMD